MTLRGVGVSVGAALGTVVRWPDPGGRADQRRSDDPERELAALDDATRVVAERLDASADEATEPTLSEILRAEASLATDPRLRDEAARLIRDDHLDAASSLQVASDQFQRRLAESDSERVSARAVDLRDVTRRIIAELRPEDAEPVQALPDDAVIVARDLGPAETATLDRGRLRAFVLEESGPTAHTAILARTYGIPAVVQVGPTADMLVDGMPVGVDGRSGLVHPDPDDACRAELTAIAEAVEDSRHSDGPHDVAHTRDGSPVELAANVGSSQQAQAAAELGAVAIGLFRTEFLFLGRDELPTEDEQEHEYRAAVQAMSGGRVVLRTLDVGGDKPLAAIPGAAEPNPMLGVRGIRHTFEHEHVLRTQLRAMLRASDAGPVGIMFPMVSDVREVVRAEQLVTRIREELLEEGCRVGVDVTIGVMVETPAAVFVAEALAQHLDFLSIGTNDLLQYLVAADRDNATVAHLLDPLHPALLRAVEATVRAGAAHDTPVAVCGEAASDPQVQLLLVGCGVSELSMVASELAATRQNLASHAASDLTDLATAAMICTHAGEVRELLDEFVMGSEPTSRLMQSDDGWSVELTLGHPEGLHVRPAEQVSRLVAEHEATVRIRTPSGEADAASVLEILALGADTGDRVELHARGDDARDVLDELVALLASA